MTARTCTLLACGTAFFLLAGCAFFLARPPVTFLPPSYTQLAVVSSQSGEPVNGASIVVGQTSFVVPDTDPDDRTTNVIVAPTDANGWTLIPIEVAFEGRATMDFVPELELAITHQAETSTLALPNLEGAVIEDSRFRVTILDIDAPLPPLPHVAVVPGSNPPTFDVEGYVELFGVCSNQDRSLAWGLRARTSRRYSAATIQLGTEPEGFFLGQDPPSVPNSPLRFCETGITSSNANAFSVYARVPFGTAEIVTEYCVDDAGTVIECEAP